MAVVLAFSGSTAFAQEEAKDEEFPYEESIENVTSPKPLRIRLAT